MNISAITSEYNPFHNGHKYHIEQTRKYGATHIVSIMSGNFVQRGDFAILSKHERAKMALLSGVDLVVEIPTIWSIASAEFFANAAIKIANSLGIVNTLSFGSECADIKLLKNVADIVENNKIKSAMSEELKKGVSFPKARQIAVKSVYGQEFSSVLASPNNILGLEYIKSINKTNSHITPVTIKREGTGHDENFVQNSFTSASHIRDLIYKNEDFSMLMPKEAYKILKENIQNFKAPVNILTLEIAILSKLRTMSKDEISNICDVTEGLENRIYNSVKTATSLDDLYSLIKTKRYPLSRIRRIILYSFLGITKQDLMREIPYIRLLGFNSNGKELLKKIKTNSSLPVVTKKSDVYSLNENAQHIFNIEQTATDLYNLATPKIQKCGLEVSQEVVVI